MANKKVRDYVDSQASSGVPTKTENLVCKDCAFRNDYRSGICDKFPMGEFKPLKVLRGGPCDEYKKE